MKLTDANRSPVAGATVSVVFYIACHARDGNGGHDNRFDLHDSGSGAYEGSGTLQSGGSWQVTISAQKNGQRLARQAIARECDGACE